MHPVWRSCAERKEITFFRFFFPASGCSAYTTTAKDWMSWKPVPVTVIFLPPLKGRIKKVVKSLANYHNYRCYLLFCTAATSTVMPITIAHPTQGVSVEMTTAFKSSNVNFKLIWNQQNKTCTNCCVSISGFSLMLIFACFTFSTVLLLSLHLPHTQRQRCECILPRSVGTCLLYSFLFATHCLKNNSLA